MLVGVKQLGEDQLATLVRDTQVLSADWVQPENLSELTSRQDSTLIRNFDDTPLAHLVWAVPSTGQELRVDLLPVALLICFSVVLICGGAAFIFRSQQKRLVQAINVACTDQLTGLLNRAGLAEGMQKDFAVSSLRDGHLGAIYLDLNKFKLLNDTYGHLAGDIALRVTAERLQSSVRPRDFVARLGGDEFVCVIFDPDPEAAMVRIAERFLKLTQSPISIEGIEHTVRASVGVAVGRPGTQWETVLSQSDAAMYWSKQEQAEFPAIYCKSMYSDDAACDDVASKRSA